MLVASSVWMIPTPVQAKVTIHEPHEVQEIKPHDTGTVPTGISTDKSNSVQKIQKTNQSSRKENREKVRPQPTINNDTVRPSFNEREIGKALLVDYGWEDQWVSLDTLWTKESGWQAGRLNSSSFACGIAQALPCTKIYSDFNQMERVWINKKLFLKNPNVEKEIRWGLNYIKARYGNPHKALQFHKLHNWY